MGNLGTMDPAELLQLLAGSLACAVVIFLFIIAYFLISRRGKRMRKGAGLGTPSFDRETSFTEYRAATSPPAGSSVSSMSSGSMGAQPAGDESSSIDVSARLVGTGREAWLEEAPSSFAGNSAADEYLPDHGQEVLRLLRDSPVGRFWIQVAGVRYRSLNDIRDRAVGERVLAAITHLLRFSNGMVATDQGIMTLELPPCDAVKVPTAFGVLSDEHEPGEVMRLLSDPDKDHVCVHVVGRCYRRLVDVREREIGQYILDAITRFLQFSNGMLSTNDGVGVVPVPPLRMDAHTPLPQSPTSGSQVSVSAAFSTSTVVGRDPRPLRSSHLAADSAEPMSEEERFLNQLGGQVPSQPQASIERPSLIRSLRRMRQASSSAETLPTLNLADEIDRIFQSKLTALGMAETDAKVETNPDGGVRIRIGAAYYGSPDEVPDAHLRDILKLSIAEWEQG